MELAAAGLYRAKWTDEIHEEWISSLLRTRTDLDRVRLERTKDLMNAAVMDANVSDYQDLIEAIKLPDPDDRHVLAAAIKGRCAAIITFNLKHFPESELSRYDIETLHPDEFIHHQFGLDRPGVLMAARNCRTRLKNPIVPADAYLRKLEAQGLPKTVAELAKSSMII